MENRSPEAMGLVEREGKSYTSREVLHLMRHDEREKLLPGQEDSVSPLTSKGRKHVHSESSPETNIRQSVAFGSPRIRAQETAARAMTGGLEEITGEESFDELKQKLDQEFKDGLGSKIGVDARLDSVQDRNTPYGERMVQAYRENRFLEALVQESDDLAVELGDDSGVTYTRGAQNVAQIIEKYLNIAPRWDKLVNNSDSDYSDTLERFFGSHQGLFESFLAKVLEKLKGVEERDRFVRALKGSGFDYSEGYNVEILNHGDAGPTVRFSYRHENELDPENSFFFDEEVPVELIREIAQTSFITQGR